MGGGHRGGCRGDEDRGGREGEGGKGARGGRDADGRRQRPAHRVSEGEERGLRVLEVEVLADGRHERRERKASRRVVKVAQAHDQQRPSCGGRHRGVLCCFRCCRELRCRTGLFIRRKVGSVVALMEEQLLLLLLLLLRRLFCRPRALLIVHRLQPAGQDQPRTTITHCSRKSRLKVPLPCTKQQLQREPLRRTTPRRRDEELIAFDARIDVRNSFDRLGVLLMVRRSHCVVIRVRREHWP